MVVVDILIMGLKTLGVLLVIQIPGDIYSAHTIPSSDVRLSALRRFPRAGG